MARSNLDWQSKLVLLLVIPCSAISLVFQVRDWAASDLWVTAWALGLSGLLGLAAWASRSGTLSAALTGALLAANLTFSTVTQPYQPWHSALVPVLVLLVLTSMATRAGRKRKEQLGTAEKRHGRVAAQVAANVGMSALAAEPWILVAIADNLHLKATGASSPLFLALSLAAMAEATADTVSSEIGQVLGGTPRMLTTLRLVPPGTDGGVTLAGTAAGVIAAGIVVMVGALALRGTPEMMEIALAGGIFGLFFDSLLGATLERRGWLNNDTVNFLSTVSASAFALGMIVFSAK